MVRAPQRRQLGPALSGQDRNGVRTRTTKGGAWGDGAWTKVKGGGGGDPEHFHGMQGSTPGCHTSGLCNQRLSQGWRDSDLAHGPQRPHLWSAPHVTSAPRVAQWVPPARWHPVQILSRAAPCQFPWCPLPGLHTQNTTHTHARTSRRWGTFWCTGSISWGERTSAVATASACWNKLSASGEPGREWESATVASSEAPAAWPPGPSPPVSLCTNARQIRQGHG